MGAENASREVCVVGGVFIGSGAGLARTAAGIRLGAGGEERRVFDVLKAVQKGDVTKVRFEEGTTRLLFDVKESSSLVASNPTMKADAPRSQRRL